MLATICGKPRRTGWPRWAETTHTFADHLSRILSSFSSNQFRLTHCNGLNSNLSFDLNLSLQHLKTRSRSPHHGHLAILKQITKKKSQTPEARDVFRLRERQLLTTNLQVPYASQRVCASEGRPNPPSAPDASAQRVQDLRLLGNGRRVRRTDFLVSSRLPDRLLVESIKKCLQKDLAVNYTPDNWPQAHLIRI
jgi:hypothetical protein